MIRTRTRPSSSTIEGRSVIVPTIQGSFGALCFLLTTGRRALTAIKSSYRVMLIRDMTIQVELWSFIVSTL